MPVYLKTIDDYEQLERFKSVLIVPCRFCPAASMAIETNRPYFQFLQRFLKTAPYEELIDSIKAKLERKGVKTDVFRSKWLHQFVVCMWTSGRRKKLLNLARNYEALVVLGCEAALDTVYDSVKSSSCAVFQGMRTQGIMGIKPRFELPCNISLELINITPLCHQNPGSAPWISL